MKKLLCLILVCLVCLICLVACFDEAPSETPGGETGGEAGGETGGENGSTPGDEPVKELTKTDVVAEVNEVIKKLNETDFSKIDTDEIFGAGDVWGDLMQQVKDNPWEFSVRSDSIWGGTGLLCAQKDGVFYITRPSEENVYYATLLQDAFVLLSEVEHEGKIDWGASYYILSTLLQNGGYVGESTIVGGNTMASGSAAIAADVTSFDFSFLSFALPSLTEDDLTVEGQVFSVSNAYLVKVCKALLDALPADMLPDDGTLATIKTLLPGMIENLNLKISFTLDGGEVALMTLSFDANQDFRALFELPDDMVMRGTVTVAGKAWGEQQAGLFLDLEITDVINLELAAAVVPATAQTPETFTFVMHGTLFDIDLASKSGDYGLYTLYGDLQIDVDLAVVPNALLTDAKNLLKATVTVTTSNLSMQSSIASEEGKATIEDIFGQNAAVNTTVTLSSAATGEKETTFTLTVHTSDAEVAIDFVLLLGSAPSFQPLPTDAAKLLDDSYGALYEELIAALEDSNEMLDDGTFYNPYYLSDFGFTTEDGYFLSFTYYGLSTGNFGVAKEALNTPDYLLTYEDGTYVIKFNFCSLEGKGNLFLHKSGGYYYIDMPDELRTVFVEILTTCTTFSHVKDDFDVFDVLLNYEYIFDSTERSYYYDPDTGAICIGARYGYGIIMIGYFSEEQQTVMNSLIETMFNIYDKATKVYA